jgi:putative hydrolase of the HAD superfamily
MERDSANLAREPARRRRSPFMPSARAIFFDAGGTLLRERRSRAAIYAEAARRHGLPAGEDEVAAAMRACHSELPQRVPGGFRYSRPWFERFFAEVFGRLGHSKLPPGLPAELFARFEDPATFRVFEDVAPVLAELGRRRIALGVVSNWSPALQELLQRLGLARHFAFVLCSSVEETEKPDPEIFRRALARAGVAAVAALHVGDTPEKDLLGAQRAGIAALLLDREQAHLALRGPRIATLAQLPRLLQSGLA